ncbi:MAG TPA: CpsB/CapC family capsule biosynthesis tyrosine phosphatase [Gemmataceae bacterium]|jgi:protein-tyrosine phosphatase|nr:CpsB/CapC family capsule biosynthesis tyrosine phosphatase [Gemmataceae bacterium]
MKTTSRLPFTDMHCHLLPGIDDGPADWEASLALARLAVAEGVGTMIATPHQLGRYEANSAARIWQLVIEARQRLADAGIPLILLPGADVRVHEDLPELVRRRQVLTLADRHVHLLMELPHEQVIPLGQLIYRLHAAGICCILSHPERNGALLQNRELLRPWVQQGCLMQITAGSITGHFGPDVQRMSRRLLEEGLVHLVGSDAHDVNRRPPRLAAAYDLVGRWLGADVADKLFLTNAEAVARGGTIEAPLPVDPARGGISGWWRTAKAVLCG